MKMTWINQEELNKALALVGMTQEQLADVMDISPTTLSQKINGETDITVEDIQFIADQLILFAENVMVIFINGALTDLPEEEREFNRGLLYNIIDLKQNTRRFTNLVDCVSRKAKDILKDGREESVERISLLHSLVDTLYTDNNRIASTLATTENFLEDCLVGTKRERSRNV